MLLPFSSQQMCGHNAEWEFFLPFFTFLLLVLKINYEEPNISNRDFKGLKRGYFVSQKSTDLSIELSSGVVSVEISSDSSCCLPPS